MLIITHFNPDIDAICAVWLLKKFGPTRYARADVSFVPAGETYKDKPVDSDPEVVHVDTGLGKFDHHQTGDDSICASSLVLDHVAGNLSGFDHEVLKRLVAVVCEVDHFKECLWPQADADRWEFMVMDLLNGLKIDNELDDRGLVDFGGVCLTGIFQSIRNKIKAEKDLKEGIVAKTVWGKTLFLESGNPSTLHLAQKKGYNLVIRKDPNKGLVKIGLRPDSKKSLEQIYRSLRRADKKADWFLHSSKRLLLNGSTKNPDMKPTSLNLTEIIDLIKTLKK
jgi:hypothetical protein